MTWTKPDTTVPTTRTLTEYEWALLAPRLHARQQADAELREAIILLGGEEWRDAQFDLSTRTFSRPEPEEKS